MDGIAREPAPRLASPIAAWVARHTRRLRIALADRLERQTWRDQFDEWAARGQTSSVLEALGLEPTQVPRFIKGVGAATRLLPAMIERTRARRRGRPVLPARQALLRVCALCPHHARCAEWLDSGAASGFEAFCPNARAFGARASSG